MSEKKNEVSKPENVFQLNMTWSTQDEIKFLEGIGTQEFYTGGVFMIDRLSALRKYLKSMDERRNWGTVSADAIRKRVERLISDEILKRRGVGAAR